MNIFPKLRKFTAVEEKFPLAMVTPDGMTITKGGEYAVVLEMTGKDYQGLDHEVVEALWSGRKQFFESLPDNITVLYQSHRHKLTRDPEQEHFEIPMAREIGTRWGKNFRISYRTRHFLIFVTSADAFQEIFSRLGAKQAASVNQGTLQDLRDTVDDAIARFASYGPRRVVGEELCSYWGWLLNGRKVHQHMPENGFLDDLLSGSDILFPLGKRYQVYQEATKKRFSAWLIIKAPANSSSHKLFDGLFQIRREFAVYQSYSKFPKKDALKEIEDRRRNVSAFTTGGDIIFSELAEMEARIQADEITLNRHRLAFEVFGDTEDEVEAAVSELKNGIEGHGYRVGRERLNQEALFWARFPGLHDWNPRQKYPTSENLAHFATFTSVGEGFESCSWGPSPVTLFKTVSGSGFSFTFHNSPAREALGNTLIVGGSESGKTTLISFLISQSTRFPGFRALCFDRLRGMEVFTSMHDGAYLDFVHSNLEINPFQLQDTPGNRAFLGSFLMMLGARNDRNEERDSQNIGQALNELYRLDKKERTLKNILDAFGLAEPGSLRSALAKWDEGGINENFFNGTKDALEFDSPLITLDMTTVLDLPEVLGPLTYYLFHRLFLKARESEGGYCVFLDELGRYLASPEFAPKVETLLQEVRKTDGVFIGAVQDLGTVLDHPIAPKVKNNIATFILFPEARADREHYVDQLGLNEREFEWIKTPRKRQVLVKRREGESVVLDVDLSPLGDYLKVFDSGASAVRRMNENRREYADWKRRFLGI
jgi:type IV secretion/conjugal transfer VirB4 family ATPase